MSVHNALINVRLVLGLYLIIVSPVQVKEPYLLTILVNVKWTDNIKKQIVYVYLTIMRIKTTLVHYALIIALLVTDLYLIIVCPVQVKELYLLTILVNATWTDI